MGELETSSRNVDVKPRRATAEAVRRDGTLRLRNAQVELVLREQDGQVLELWNRKLNWNFKASPDGAWPISYWIRHPIYPWWGGRPKHLPPCPEEYLAVPVIKVLRGTDGVTVRLDYPELAVLRRGPMDVYPGVLTGEAAPDVQAARDMAGIAARVEISLPHEADYFLMRTRLDLRHSECEVVRFGSGWGGAIRVDEDHAHEHLAAPEWYGGAVYDNPHAMLNGPALTGKTMLWPYIGGSQNSLLAGWVDLYGRRGGLGIGYIGRSGQIGAFEAAPDGDGLSLNWRTFDLSGVNTYFGDIANGFAGLYPLEPGKRYTSDWWIVAPHEGDWHRMADIYRAEYEKEYAGEFLTAETISPAVQSADYILPVWFPYHPGGRHLDSLPAAVRAEIETLGVEPEQVLVWIIGTQAEGFDTTFPDFFPMHPQCGGEEAARRTIAELRAMGIGGAFIYTNPSYNHSRAKLFVPEADTGIRANHGNFACFASPRWEEMWRTKLAPRLLDVGASGIQIDQWPLVFCPCRLKGHGHRTDSLSVLREQVLGKRRWLKSLRDTLAAGEPSWFFFSEGGTDAAGALADIWQFGHRAHYPGGRPAGELARFTHPQYRMMTGQPMLEGLVNGFLVYAVEPALSGDPAEPARKQAASPEFQEYRRVRSELRAAAAPGFPYGFRDTLGLAVSSPDVEARAYRDANGITVLYFARKDAQARIEVRPAELDHPGEVPQSIPVSLKAGQAGWWKQESGVKSQKSEPRSQVPEEEYPDE
jgi:hypothetical protein